MAQDQVINEEKFDESLPGMDFGMNSNDSGIKVLENQLKDDEIIYETRPTGEIISKQSFIGSEEGGLDSSSVIPVFNAGENLYEGDVVYPSGSNLIERVRPTSFASNSATFSEPTGNRHKMLRIDSTRSLHINGGARVSAAAITAYIGTLNAGETDMAYGTVYNFGGINCAIFDVCQFDTYKFLVIYQQSASQMKAVVLDVGSSGDTITPGTAVNIDAAADDADYVACCGVDSGRVALSYKQSSDSKLYIQIVSISGTTITTSTPALLGSGTNSNKIVTLLCFAIDKVLAVFAEDGSDPLVAKVVTLTGTSASVAGSNTLNSTSQQYLPSLALINQTKVALVYSYSDGAADRKVQAAILTITGNTVAKGTDLQLATIDQVDQYINVIAISSSVLLTATRESNTSIKYHLLYVDGTTITSITTVTITTAGNNYASSWVCKFKPFKYLGAAGEQYSFVTLGGTANKFIGIMTQDIQDTLATTKALIARFGFNSRFTGLTAGSVYYVDDNGQISTDSSLLSVTFGVAVTDKVILVQ